MRSETIRSLLEVDRRFYRAAGEAFDATRRTPWGGWRRLSPRLGANPPSTVLDVGCGNGRFASFLAAERVPVEHYTGLDSAPYLLTVARERVRGGVFLETDVITGGLSVLDPAARFDFIAVFGLLHHVPSRELRQRLLGECVARLAPRGLLAVTVWRFLDSVTGPPVIPWGECEERCGVAVDEADLEPGDTLLGFGTDPSHVRYAHHFAAHETSALAAHFGDQVVESFDADGDGRSNRYLLIERSG